MPVLRSSSLAALFAGLVTALGAPSAAGQAPCRPAIATGPSSHSDVVNRQRRWTGLFTVDASPCATATGFFTVHLVRLKESGPDLGFTELFTWEPGETAAHVDLAWDEYVSAHEIGDIAPCSCRR